MATTTLQSAGVATPAGAGQRRYLWLGLGAVLSLFAVGGRWDLPLAAWLFQVFLLRFSRTSRPGVGLGLVWLASVAAVLFWIVQLAVPVQASTLASAILFGTVFTLPYAMDRWLAPRLGTAGRLLLYPAARAACEFAMGVFSPLGTAYGLLAVTQHANLSLLQVIAITGPYAISFLIAWFATTANALWETDLRRARPAILAYAAVLALVVGGGAIRLAFFPPASASVSVAGISPSTAVTDAAQRALGQPPAVMRDVAGRDPAAMRAAFRTVNDELASSTRRAAAAGARVVVWSENGALLLAADEPAFLAQAQALAKETGVYLDVADHVYLPAAPFGRDETHLIGPDGKLLWTYEKAHPIPGLEGYIPGDGKVPVVQTPFGRVANVICYDADFPAQMRADADIMLVPGGDWPQMGRVHTLKMASLRAIEQGHALFRQDVNGLSAAFDDQGHILATQDTTGPGAHMMIADVPTKGGATPYRLMGDVFAWTCVAGVVLLVGLALLGPRRSA